METGAHVPRCGVVKKVAAFPSSAPKTDAAVSKAVINSTIESDVWPPITRVPTVNAAPESPVTGRPKQHRHEEAQPTHPESSSSPRRP